MLTKWADYLVKEGLDPQNQLCSADMFGHLPRNANLALKAIIGIGGYAQLCELAGKPDDAKKYLAIARDYAAKWQELAKDDGRTRLAYDQPGTWGMKHNLIWDRVLGLNLFPQSVGDAEIAWYLKVQKKYGLPVDNRTDTSLIDWALWSIAPARNDADFQALLDPIWRYANETPVARAAVGLVRHHRRETEGLPGAPGRGRHLHQDARRSRRLWTEVGQARREHQRPVGAARQMTQSCASSRMHHPRKRIGTADGRR